MKLSWQMQFFLKHLTYLLDACFLIADDFLCFLQIWNQYFSAKDTVYAVIPVSSPSARENEVSRKTFLPGRVIAFIE